jgi:hypothetical protein
MSVRFRPQNKAMPAIRAIDGVLVAKFHIDFGVTQLAAAVANNARRIDLGNRFYFLLHEDAFKPNEPSITAGAASASGLRSLVP